MIRDNCDKALTFKVKNHEELLDSFFLFPRWETSGGAPKRPRSRIWRYELLLHSIIFISYEYKVLSSSAYLEPDHGMPRLRPAPQDSSSSPSGRVSRCSKASQRRGLSGVPWVSSDLLPVGTCTDDCGLCG